MKSIAKNHASFYISITSYIAYIFLANWSSSASGIDNVWLSITFSTLANLALMTCCLFIIYRIVNDFNYYAKHKWFSLIFLAIIIFLFITLNSISIALPIALGLVSVKSQNRALAKTIVQSMIILLLMSCALNFLGLTGGDTISKPLFGDDSYYSTTMTALGLSNPNSVMIIFFNVIALSLYLCKTKRQSRYVSMTLSIIAIFFSSITGSTTGVIIGLTTIILINMARYHKKVSNTFRRITPWMFIIVTIVTFVIGVSFGSRNSIPNPVNDALTTRPYMWNLRIENGSYINIYGNNDQYQADRTTENNITYSLDNMTLYILIHYGVVIYLIFFYIFYFGSKKIQDPVILVYIFMTCTLMLVERMYLYSIVLIFLQKGITEYYLLKKNSTERNIYAKN